MLFHQKHGSQLPSSERLTVRQALYELRIEGYVIREKGRGTFIARTPVPIRVI